MLSCVSEDSEKKYWFLGTEAKGGFAFWKDPACSVSRSSLGYDQARPGGCVKAEGVCVSGVPGLGGAGKCGGSGGQFSETRPAVGQRSGTHCWPRDVTEGVGSVILPFILWLHNSAQRRKPLSPSLLMRSTTGLAIGPPFLGSGPYSGKHWPVWPLDNHPWQLFQPWQGSSQLEDSRPGKKLEGRWIPPSLPLHVRSKLRTEVLRGQVGKSDLSGRQPPVLKLCTPRASKALDFQAQALLKPFWLGLRRTGVLAGWEPGRGASGIGLAAKALRVWAPLASTDLVKMDFHALSFLCNILSHSLRSAFQFSEMYLTYVGTIVLQIRD